MGDLGRSSVMVTSLSFIVKSKDCFTGTVTSSDWKFFTTFYGPDNLGDCLPGVDIADGDRNCDEQGERGLYFSVHLTRLRHEPGHSL